MLREIELHKALAGLRAIIAIFGN